VDTHLQALFDTPTQQLVGAKHILKTIAMKEFPFLSKLQIKFLTDFCLCVLQQEFDKLGDIIELVNLVNVVVANDKVCARVTVPQSGSWKSFSASMARTKWLFKAVDSVLPTSTEMEEELDGQKTPDCSDVYEWFNCILGEKDPDAFLRAAQKLGVPVALKSSCQKN